MCLGGGGGAPEVVLRHCRNKALQFGHRFNYIVSIAMLFRSLARIYVNWQENCAISLKVKNRKLNDKQDIAICQKRISILPNKDKSRQSTYNMLKIKKN